MNIAILGFDREGHSSYDYFAAQGHTITICDQKTDIAIPDDCHSVLGEAYLDNLDRFDLLVRTAGLPSQAILDKNPLVAGKITTQINEFFASCPSKQIIGITGTKGKGTTATLITNMLQAAGKQVELAGNIGIPPLSLLPKLNSDSWVVLELSSYQLSDVQASPHIGVCLMIAPEHLNWHGSMAAYIEAKSQLFAHQTAADIAIYYAPNELSEQIAATGAGHKLPYFAPPGAIVDNGVISISGQEICRTDELQLVGEHNWQNACAALTAVWQVTQDVAAIRSVLTSFQGLPFRLENRGEKRGIYFYNDSFASAPPAPLAAIDALAGQKVVILGGFDRGLDLNELVSGLIERSTSLKQLILIGATAKLLAKELQTAGFDRFQEVEGDMKTIVRAAAAAATAGDTVILSPGFASFDMFKDFEDRGRQFNQAVEEL